MNCQQKVQNFTQKNWTEVQIFQKVLGGATFYTLYIIDIFVPSLLRYPSFLYVV